MIFSRLICLPMFCRYTMWGCMWSLGLAFVFTWYQSKCHWLELIWLAFRSFARGGRYWSCFSAIVSSHNINTTSLYATIKTRSAAAISHFECSRLGFLLLYASCEERQRALLTNSIVVEFFESTAATRVPASPFRADKNLAYSMHISLLRIIPASILDIADEMCRGRFGWRAWCFWYALGSRILWGNVCGGLLQLQPTNI